MFTHYDGYHRAEQIAGGGKALGLTFCVGKSEGGTHMGKDVFEMIRDSGIRRAGTAYCIACMRALLRRANEEVG